MLKSDIIERLSASFGARGLDRSLIEGAPYRLDIGIYADGALTDLFDPRKIAEGAKRLLPNVFSGVLTGNEHDSRKRDLFSKCIPDYVPSDRLIGEIRSDRLDGLTTSWSELKREIDNFRATPWSAKALNHMLDACYQYIAVTHIVNAWYMEQMFVITGEEPQPELTNLVWTASAARFDKDAYTLVGLEVPEKCARKLDGFAFFRRGRQELLMREITALGDDAAADGEASFSGLPRFICLAALKQSLRVVDAARLHTSCVASSSKAAIEASLAQIPWQRPRLYQDSLLELGKVIEALEVVAAEPSNEVPALEPALEAVRTCIQVEGNKSENGRTVSDALPAIAELLKEIERLKAAISTSIAKLSDPSPAETVRMSPSEARDIVLASHYREYAAATNALLAADFRYLGKELMMHVPLEDRPAVMSRVMTLYGDEDTPVGLLTSALRAIAEDSSLPHVCIEEAREREDEGTLAAVVPGPAVVELTVEEHRRDEFSLNGYEALADVVEVWIPDVFTCDDERFHAVLAEMNERSRMLRNALREAEKAEVSPMTIINSNPDLFFTNDSETFAEYVQDLEQFVAVWKNLISGQRDCPGAIWELMDFDVSMLASPESLRQRLSEVHQLLPEEGEVPAEPTVPVHGREAIFNDEERARLIEELNSCGFGEHGSEGGEAAYKILTKGFISKGQLFTGDRGIRSVFVRRNSGVESHIFDDVFERLLRKGAIAQLRKPGDSVYVLTMDVANLGEPFRTIILGVREHI